MDFLERLLASPQGQVVLANVLDGLNDNLYDEQFVRVIFDWWSAFHDWWFPAGTIGHTGEKELLGSLDLLLLRDCIDNMAEWLAFGSA